MQEQDDLAANSLCLFRVRFRGTHVAREQRPCQRRRRRASSSDCQQKYSMGSLEHNRAAFHRKVAPSTENEEKSEKKWRRKQLPPAQRRTRLKNGRSKRAALGRLLDEPRSSSAAMAVFFMVITAILVSVATFYLSSVKSLTEPDGGHTVWVVEACCVAVFTLEVSMRTVVATLDLKRLLLKDAYFYIDILAILPFYIDLIIDDPGNGFRWMALLRLLRILKLLRHCERSGASNAHRTAAHAMRVATVSSARLDLLLQISCPCYIRAT